MSCAADISSVTSVNDPVWQVDWLQSIFVHAAFLDSLTSNQLSSFDELRLVPTSRKKYLAEQ